MSFRHEIVEIASARHLTREVNERVFEAQGSFVVPGPAEFFCECSDERCTERLVAPQEEYAWAHGRPDTWLLVPGHGDTDDTVVRWGPGYVLVVGAAGVFGSEE